MAEYAELQQQIELNFDPEISGEAYARELKNRFQSNINAFDKFYDGRTAEINKKLTNRLYYNPIDYILAYGLDILGDDESVTCQILDGTWQPQDYTDMNIPELGAGNFWGSTQPSIYGNILYLMARKKTDPIHLNQNSSFLHVTPLDSDLVEPLLNSEYLYQNGSQYGLAFAHTGYIYNGNRMDNVLYTTEKTYAPKDCSQFVQEMLGHQNAFITEDMLYTYRRKTCAGYIRKNWQESPIAHELCNNLVPVSVEDVQPGDIHVKWDFRSGAKPTNSRINFHGHTTIVFSKQGNEVLTLGDGQSVPYRDGFGLETYSARATETHKHGITETRFFRAKA